MLLSLSFSLILWFALEKSGYDEYSVTTISFLGTKIIGNNVKKFEFKKHPVTTSNFFCIFNSLQATPCVFLLVRAIVRLQVSLDLVYYRPHPKDRCLSVPNSIP